MSEDRQAAVAELLRRGAIDQQSARAMLGDGPQVAAPADAPSGLARYAQKSLGQLGSGLADVPAYAGEALGDFFRSLLPTREGAEAGAREVGRAGDIGMALAGGGVSPLGGVREPSLQAIGQRVGGLMTPLREPPPRVLPPQLALPAPDRLGLPAPSAGRMPPHMNVQPPAIAPPLRQLPAPDVNYIPGRPPTQVGQGMIPGTPGATMRPGEQPPVGPGYDPAMVRFPRPAAPQPAATTPSPAAPDVPQHPGVVYGGRMAQTPSQARPSEPFVTPAAERPPSSSFAQALASNDSTPIDRTMTQQYRRLVSPSRPGRSSLGGINEQDRQIQTAVDTIIEQKQNLNLTDPGGREIPKGQLPRTLHQFSEAIDNLKDQIFTQYDNLAKQVGGQGVRIPLSPAIQRLAAMGLRPEFVDVSPAIKRELDAQIAAWQQRGSYSPREAQSVLRQLNKESEAVIKSGGQEGSARATMLNEARSGLMSTLNDAMTAALRGPQYQALRNRFGALTSIEENVGNAMLKEMAKKPGIGVTEKVLDFATAGGVLHGIATLNPATVASTVGARAAAEAMRRYSQYLRSPNRAVTQLFQSRARTLDPTWQERMSARAAVELGEMRQRRYDAIRSGDLTDAGFQIIR